MTPTLVTEDLLQSMVTRALTTSEPLDRIFTEVVWGGRCPEMWRDWPQASRDAWDAACRLWFRIRGHAPGRRRAPNVRILSVQEVWSAVLLSSRQSDPGRRLTWADIAGPLDVSPKGVQYQSLRMGFFFLGQPPNRELARAVCLVCSSPYAFRNSPFCPSCAEPDTEPDTSAFPIDLGPYQHAQPPRENRRTYIRRSIRRRRLAG